MDMWWSSFKVGRRRRVKRASGVCSGVFGIAVVGCGRSLWLLSLSIAVGWGHAQANVVIAVQGERHHH